MSKAKYIVINIDCPDRFNFQLRNSDYENICEGEQTYIPEWLSCAETDSQLRLIIDMETGQIINWRRPDKKYVDKTILEYTQED